MQPLTTSTLVRGHFVLGQVRNQFRASPATSYGTLWGSESGFRALAAQFLKLRRYQTRLLVRPFGHKGGVNITNFDLTAKPVAEVGSARRGLLHENSAQHGKGLLYQPGNGNTY